MANKRIYQNQAARQAAYRKRHPKLTHRQAYALAKRLHRAIKGAAANLDPDASRLVATSEIATLNRLIDLYELRSGQLTLHVDIPA